MQEYIFPEALRREVKSPIGRLLKDSEVRKKDLEFYFGKSNLTVCVGDRTTERMNEFGLLSSLEIIDTIERRVHRPPPKLVSADQPVLRALNRPGTISSDALLKLGQSLDLILQNKQKTIRLVIDGEEDLLVLPVVAFFPTGTVVFYGQPGEGLVIIDSKDSAENAKRMLLQLGIRSLS